MSVKSRLMTQSGEHWANDDGEDNGDLIVFLVPPVPNYAAPPPPVGTNVSPRPGMSSSAGIPFPKSTSSTPHKPPTSANTHSVPPHRPPSHNAPPVPTKVAPTAPRKDIRNSNGLANSSGAHNVPISADGPTPALTPSKTAPLRPQPKVSHIGPTSSPNLAAIRNHPLSNTVAAFPGLEAKKSAHPPVPSNPAPNRPAKSTGTDVSYKPMILVPVLPVGPNGVVRETSLSPRELAASNGSKGNNSVNGSSTANSSSNGGNTSPRDGNYAAAHARSVSVSASMQQTPYQLPIGGPAKFSLTARDRAGSAAAGVSSTTLPAPGGTQSIITAPSRPSLRVDDSISDNRVIQEIVITHEDYVQDLCLTLSVFALPMKERSIVSADVHDIFFEGLENLISVEQAMMRDLKGKKALKPIDVAQIFQAHLTSLHVYIPFCARQDRTLKLMTEQLSTNPSFASFCEEVRKIPECRGLSFDAFIIKPLQRLCKLPLLFRELSKTLDAGSNGASASNGSGAAFSNSLTSLPSLSSQSSANLTRSGAINPTPNSAHRESSSAAGAGPLITDERRKVDATQFMLEQILDEINQSTGDADKLVDLERNLLKKYPHIATLNLQHRKLLLDGDIAWVVKESKDQVKLRMGHFWLLDQVLLFCRSPKELDFIMPLNTASISKNLPAVQNFNYVLELSDMTANGLVTRKLCLTDSDLYHTLITKLS